MTKSTALRILGALLILVAVLALVWDVVDPEVPAGSDASQSGFQFGSTIGIALRTLILGAIGAALLKRGSFGPSRADELRQILADNQALLPQSEPAGAERYVSTSDADLIDAYHHIDRAAHPDRFAALLWALAERASKPSGGS